MLDNPCSQLFHVHCLHMPAVLPAPILALTDDPLTLYPHSETCFLHLNSLLDVVYSMHCWSSGTRNVIAWKKCTHKTLRSSAVGQDTSNKATGCSSNTSCQICCFGLVCSTAHIVQGNIGHDGCLICTNQLVAFAYTKRTIWHSSTDRQLLLVLSHVLYDAGKEVHVLAVAGGDLKGLGVVRKAQQKVPYQQAVLGWVLPIR